MLNGQSIICFANDWKSDPLSKKHVMVRLARRNRILWVNSLHNRRPRVSRKDASRVWQKLQEFFRGVEAVEPNIWQITPLYLPWLGSALMRSINAALLRWQLLGAMRRLGLRDPITWTFAPTSGDIAGTLGEQLVVYHCVDQFAAFGDAAAEIRNAEERLIRNADVVLASSVPLMENKRPWNSNVHLALHGVDYEHFCRAADAQTAMARELASLPRPVLGFHGLIADWVDLPLLADLARLRPNWSIVLVGRPDTDISSIQGIPNVHLLGHRPYEELPNYLRGFDVALLPFVKNELTISANPLKLREYLAAGLPVVATPIPEVERLAPPVRLASTAEEYAQQIERILAQGRAGPSPQRSREVCNESWDKKVEEMEELVSDTLARKHQAAPAPSLTA